MADMEMRVALLEQAAKRTSLDTEEQKSMTQQMIKENTEAHESMRESINTLSQKTVEVASILQGKQEQRDNTSDNIKTAVVVISVIIALISITVALAS